MGARSAAHRDDPSGPLIAGHVQTRMSYETNEGHPIMWPRPPSSYVVRHLTVAGCALSLTQLVSSSGAGALATLVRQHEMLCVSKPRALSSPVSGSARA